MLRGQMARPMALAQTSTVLLGRPGAASAAAAAGPLAMPSTTLPIRLGAARPVIVSGANGV